MKIPTVYILASKARGALYTGVTSNLIVRVWQHYNHQTPGFTSKYRTYRLVWFEVHETMESAICREKQIKGWRRQWKLELIERTNPQWNNLFATLD